MRDALYRQVAIGDLVLFSVLAVPVLGAWVLDLLLALNAWLEWSGSLPTSAGVYLLLHLLGLLGAGLAFLRMRIGARSDAIAATIVVKLAAATLFAIGVVAGAPAVLLILGAVDLLQGLALLLCSMRSAAPPGLENVESTQ